MERRNPSSYAKTRPVLRTDFELEDACSPARPCSPIWRTERPPFLPTRSHSLTATAPWPPWPSSELAGAAAVFPSVSSHAPHEHNHHLRLPLLHSVLVLTIQNRAGSTAAAGRRRLWPPVHVAGPPQAAYWPSVTTSGCVRVPFCSAAPSPPPTSTPTAGPDFLCSKIPPGTLG